MKRKPEPINKTLRVPADLLEQIQIIADNAPGGKRSWHWTAIDALVQYVEARREGKQ